MQYNNPILPGFHPDPSICRVGEMYYLVTSSFAYFPGVPIFESRDLIHWQQINYCLTRPEQISLQGADSSLGIWAPTLRFHAGRFYMTTTNMSGRGNFYVSSDDPSGTWSDPIWINQDGIDPSLFFDTDGKVYFTSNGDNPPGIYQSEIDITTGALLTEPRLIWTGTGGMHPEGPHLYKIGAWYYLMIAEGGTWYGHMETLARSSSPWGPFTPCPRNPILTHRDRANHPIQGTGHADLVQASDGNWWLIFLAYRPRDISFHHLGRETFLAPVRWDQDGWPVIGNNGTVELAMQGPVTSEHPWPSVPKRDNFSAITLRLDWNFLRNPHPATWSLEERPGWLRLRGSAITLDDRDSPAWLGRRQEHFACRVETQLDFTPGVLGEEAGLTVYANERHHYEIGLTWHSTNTRRLFVRRRIGDLSAIVFQTSLPTGLVTLAIETAGDHYTFCYALHGEAFQPVAEGATRYLATEVAGGFSGVYFALYATGNRQQSVSPADFAWFEYRVIETTRVSPSSRSAFSNGGFRRRREAECLENE